MHFCHVRRFVDKTSLAEYKYRDREIFVLIFSVICTPLSEVE